MLLSDINTVQKRAVNLTIYDCCRAARDKMFVESNGDRPFAPNYLVLITDGQSDNRTATWLEAVAARARAITVLAVS